MPSFLELVVSAVGTPYVYGGDTPGGFDCSGLVYWAAGGAGMNGVPRTSSEQFVAPALTPVASPGPGDLVFFYNGEPGPQPGHVGVCADAGCSTMIDAPHSGALVRQESVAGFGAIAGYRRLPGANVAGRATATNAALDIPLPGGGVSIPDPTDALGDVAGDVLGPITQVLAQLPTEFLKVFLGDHTIGEVVFRTLETFAGAILFAVGGIMLVRAIASGGEPARVSSNLSRTARGGRRTVRSVHRHLDTHLEVSPRQGGTAAGAGTSSAVTRTRRTLEGPR